ncbi:hypothetical protein PGIGA_G00177150, partial [Pangasianodon gigas]|nr:hypothetical protein [Pangasianodon gigas]
MSLTDEITTHGDPLLKGTNIEDLIKKNKPLCELVQQCGGIYHVFNNKNLGSRDQVSVLLQKIDRMMENKGGIYDSRQEEEKGGESRIRRKEDEQKQKEEEQRYNKHAFGSS